MARTVTPEILSLYTRISKGKGKVELTASSGGGLALTNGTLDVEKEWTLRSNGW